MSCQISQNTEVDSKNTHLGSDTGKSTFPIELLGSNGLGLFYVGGSIAKSQNESKGKLYTNLEILFAVD